MPSACSRRNFADWARSLWNQQIKRRFRPEARWRRRSDDILGLVLLQRQLVSAALDLVRPGGIVLYATCSPVLSETRGVVSSVLDTRRDVVLEDVAALLPQVPDCAGPVAGTVQLWPHRHGTDAMFLALLRRTDGGATA